ncbi:transcription initiation factor IIB family protein [Halobaculum roseum]|nr:transcription initiation factor IIB family protein [Halobaculum roseum]
MTGAEAVCDDCGLVLADEEVDLGPEWRFAGEDGARKRTGAPRTPARHDRGLSTRIGRTRDGKGNALDGDTRRRFARLRREQRRSKTESKADRNRRHGFTQIRRMASALGLGDSLRDQACRLFETAQDDGLLVGRSIEAMSAAAVYAACRCTGRPETRGDVSRVAQVSRARVDNAYTSLNRELGLPVPPREPATFLPKLVSALELPRAVERRARDVLDASPSVVGTAGHPQGIAGGAILVAARELNVRDRFSQAELATAADVTPVTLRKHRNALE